VFLLRLAKAVACATLSILPLPVSKSLIHKGIDDRSTLTEVRNRELCGKSAA
jgi:hypothetical protein